jgi:hypothetical protein
VTYYKFNEVCDGFIVILEEVLIFFFTFIYIKGLWSTFMDYGFLGGTFFL